jgi:hypothetical protein
MHSWLPCYSEETTLDARYRRRDSLAPRTPSTSAPAPTAAYAPIEIQNVTGS